MVLAYLLTFRCYGTWLHGDQRGSVDDKHNAWQEPLLETNARLQNFRRKTMKAQRVVLDEIQGACGLNALHDVAVHRKWRIHEICAMSNHVHLVVSAPEEVAPEKMSATFKAWATR